MAFGSLLVYYYLMGTFDGPNGCLSWNSSTPPIIVSITIIQIVYFGVSQNAAVLVNMLIRCFGRHLLQNGSTHNCTLQSNMLNKSNKHSIEWKKTTATPLWWFNTNIHRASVVWSSLVGCVVLCSLFRTEDINQTV